MFSIGDFAQYGRVSARMLRHYDAIGLLRPARTDPVSGYRFYEAAQLARLNRIIALKDLGFSLQQVGAILAEEVSVPELRGMLRLRQAELEASRRRRRRGWRRSRRGSGRSRVRDACLPTMWWSRRTGTVLLAELSGTAASYGPEDIGPVITPLYAELCRRLETAGVTPAGPGLAYYEDATGAGAGEPAGGRKESGGAKPTREAIVVHAGIVITEEALAKAGAHRRPPAAPGHPGTPTATGLGFDVVALPALDSAATVVHRGPMSRILPTAQNLAHWIDANGYRSAGYARELYLECPPDQEKWVTEIQEPVVRA